MDQAKTLGSLTNPSVDLQSMAQDSLNFVSSNEHLMDVLTAYIERTDDVIGYIDQASLLLLIPVIGLASHETLVRFLKPD